MRLNEGDTSEYGAQICSTFAEASWPTRKDDDSRLEVSSTLLAFSLLLFLCVMYILEISQRPHPHKQHFWVAGLFGDATSNQVCKNQVALVVCFGVVSV